MKTVVLERADRTVREVLKAVRAQTGFEVELSGVEPSRRIVFEAGGRPVLEVLDGLARALGGGTVQMKGVSGDSPGSLEVVVGKEAAPPAAFHWRQFRVEVADVRVTVTRSLRGIGRRADVILRLKAQPGVRPLEVGRFAAEEAVDDAGWSVLVPPERRSLSSMEWDEGEDPDAVVFGERFGRGSGGRGSWDFEASLSLPAKEAGAIARLRGRIPLTFPMRRVEVSVPADDLRGGKDVRVGPMTIRFLSFVQDGLKATVAFQTAGGRGGRRARDFEGIPHFELRDEAGVNVARGYSGGGSEDGYKMEYVLARDAPVASLHVSAFVGIAVIHVPVDLRDLPLPGTKGSPTGP